MDEERLKEGQNSQEKKKAETKRRAGVRRAEKGKGRNLGKEKGRNLKEESKAKGGRN